MALAGVLGCQNEPLPKPSTATFEMLNSHDLRDLMEDLSEKSKTNLQLSFRGTCRNASVLGQLSSEGSPAIAVRSQQVIAGLDIESQLRNILGPHVSFRAMQSGRGIEAVVGDPTRVILDTPMRSVRFSESDRYNPEMVYEWVETPEVKKVMEGERARRPIHALDYLDIPIDPQYPHLPESMQDVTVRDVFNEMQKRFHGVWIYSDCIRQDGGLSYDLDFFYRR